jgi:SAM-dependent methyltransferase
MEGAGVERGSYARKQLFNRVRLLAWSHRRRFEDGRRVVAAAGGGSLLDYGCGDGSFIAATHDLFSHSLGIEIDPELVRQCRAALGHAPGVEFGLPQSLDPLPAGGFDVVACMEVLEHCTPESRTALLRTLHRHVRQDGIVVISVPNETGGVLLLKQAVRALAGLRGYEHYRKRETYSPRELAVMLFARPDTAIPRPAYPSALPHGPPLYHGHKGFNWRALQRELELLFDIERVQFSPVAALGQRFASQVWFICRARPDHLQATSE